MSVVLREGEPWRLSDSIGGMMVHVMMIHISLRNTPNSKNQQTLRSWQNLISQYIYSRLQMAMTLRCFLSVFHLEIHVTMLWLKAFQRCFIQQGAPTLIGFAVGVEIIR